MEKIRKLIIFAFMCSWVLFLPSLAGALLITGSGIGTNGEAISASADFTFTTHNFGSGNVSAVQIVLTNTSSSLSYRGNLLTGFFWSWDNVGNLGTASASFDGLAATVLRSSDGTLLNTNLDIAPTNIPPAPTGTYRLGNIIGTTDTIDNLLPVGRDWSDYSYVIATVGYGLGALGGGALGGDTYGIAPAGITSFGSGTIPFISGSATFWIATPAGLTSLDQITNFAFGHGSLPDNVIYTTVGKVPEPLTLILYGFGFAGAGLYRHLRRMPK